MSKLKSMTGSANRIVNSDLINFTLNIISVNSRFLETYFRLPDSIRHLEPHFKKVLQEKVSRGKFDIQISLEKNMSSSLNINDAALDALKNAIVKVQSAIPGSKFNALDILNYPGVIAQENAGEKIDECILDNFSQALDDLIASRESEGDKLKKTIEERLDAVSAQADEVEKVLSTLVATERERILSKLESMKLDIELDKNRIEQEVVLAAQKADIGEEYDRLRAHVKEVHNILNKGGICGKRLDFMMQEFNRESNTLASKASNLEITKIAVELKVLIEQMREQVQNIE